MRARGLNLISAVILLVCAWFAPGALGANVIVLGSHDRARTVLDRFVQGPALTPAPSLAAGSSAVIARVAGGARPRGGPTMVSELGGLLHAGTITSGAYRQYLSDWKVALATEKRLRGTRATELEGVIENLHTIAAAGGLTPSRLPAMFLTLERNRQWWTGGPLLSYGQRVEFAGSGLVWEYYPGEGIELQALASFGKANALYAAGAADYPALAALLAQLIPLASHSSGGLAWDYYFNWDGGRPPWASAMAQGTALEALTHAYEAFRDPAYLQVAAQALQPLAAPPPVGLSVTTPRGRRFLQYSFAPDTDIINAFLQTLIGLYEYAHASGNTEALALFNAGSAQAQAELPQFNTGAWSLYQPGIEDPLSYHVLVTGFLQQLCTLTAVPLYCSTAAAFKADLTTPPALTQLTLDARAGSSFRLLFRLSKESHVGVVLLRGGRSVFLTSAEFGYGVDAFAIPPLTAAGTYTVHLAATDLAGNFSRIVGSLALAPRRPRSG